jgi:hypothetical protein
MFDHSLFVPSRAYVSNRCGKWYAWHDFSEGATPTLYVTGECLADVPGLAVSLQRSVRQGSNPRVLVLDKVLVAQSGAMNSRRIDVRYEEPTITRYTQVHIQPDALFIDVVVPS